MSTLVPVISDRRARSGSNLPRNRIGSLRQKAAAELHADWQRFSKLSPGEVRRMVSKADLRRVAALAAEAKAGWHADNLRAPADAAEWEARRQAVRLKLDRALSRAVPRYRAVRRLQSVASRRFSDWLKRLRPKNQGTVIAPDVPADASIFRAPFPLYDSRVVLGPEFHIEVTDRSFTLPDSGQLIIDAEYDNDEHTSFSDGLWGLLYLNGAEVMASCGVPYRMPREGPIRIDAEIRNFYNHATLSLKDNWGFSEGELTCSYHLFGSVIRPARESIQRQLLVTQQIDSGGDNKSAVMADIEQTTHRLSVQTEATFPAGESVWIMAGASVYVFSRLDDMQSRVRALQWWQVDQIAVSTI